MKAVKWIIIIVLALVAGSALTLRAQGHDVLAEIVESVTAEPVSTAAPGLLHATDTRTEQLAPAAPVSLPPVGYIGVLEAIGSDSLSLSTKDGMTILPVNEAAGLENGSSAIDQVKSGDNVAVWTQTVNGQPVVSKIVVIPTRPTRMHYVGLVADISETVLHVVGRQGEITAFRLDSTLSVLPEGATRPEVGNTVTVVAKPDPLGDGWSAVSVVKQ